MNDDTSPIQAPPTDDERVAANAQLQAQYLELTAAVAHEEDNPAPATLTAEQVRELGYQAWLNYRYRGTHPDPNSPIGAMAYYPAAALEHLADAVTRQRDPGTACRRAAVILAAARHPGTPMRCQRCQRLYTLLDVLDLGITGREDTTCPQCLAEQPPPPVIEPAAVHSPGRRRKPATPARPRTAARQARNGSTP